MSPAHAWRVKESRRECVAAERRKLEPRRANKFASVAELTMHAEPTMRGGRMRIITSEQRNLLEELFLRRHRLRSIRRYYSCVLHAHPTSVQAVRLQRTRRPRSHARSVTGRLMCGKLSVYAN